MAKDWKRSRDLREAFDMGDVRTESPLSSVSAQVTVRNAV